MFKLGRLRCSFCGKSAAEVSKLVAGPRVYICDACVAVASRLMEGDTHDDGPPHTAGQSVWRRVSARARRLLGGDGARRVCPAAPTVRG
jgi:ATP-dependent protease Clp ATPase subunit